MSLDLMTETLGGSSVLHKEIRNDTDLYTLAQSGIPKQALSAFADHIGWSVFNLIESYLGVWISYRTFQRKKENELLAPTVSEQILRLAKVYVRGVEVFDGDVEDFSRWLTIPSKPLGNKEPQELLKNGFGAQMVLEQLDRMEYGIYS